MQSSEDTRPRTATPASHCPLCACHAITRVHQDAKRNGHQVGRTYEQCTRCRLVFVPAEYHLAPDDERSVYEQHNNHPGDSGYRAFLGRVCTPMVARISSGARGLDFGCGPGPTLSAMFREAGFACAEYDPFFAPEQQLLRTTYNFVTATEVLEHLRKPRADIDRLIGLLAPGGWLGIMTKRVTTPEAFAQWHYIRDPTHIAFWSEATFVWVAAEYDLSLHIENADTVLLRKRA